MRATVITDASFCGQTGAAGWALWVSMDNLTPIKLSGKFKDRPKNSTQAEIWAAYNGMKIAYGAGARNILIQSDCMAVLTAVSKPRSKHGFHEFSKTHIPGAWVKFRHVKGHTSTANARSYVNRWCDKQAKKHMKEWRSKINAG